MTPPGFRTQTGVQGIALGAFALAGVFALSQADPAAAQRDRSAMSRQDVQFARKAAQGGLAEVRLGELASQRGSSDAVRSFGQKMVEDHTKANTELTRIATDKRITLPMGLDYKAKATLARLRRLHGAAFDSAYIRDMQLDHQMDISEFRQESRLGKDTDLKGFATSTLPIITEHYKMVRDMAHGGKMGRM